MKTTARKIRPPVKRHGGKSYLAKRIISLMPEHRVYVEPFVGGGSVLLNKPRAEVEIAADLDEGLIGMWKALADQPERIAAVLGSTEYSEGNFDWARFSIENHGPAGLPASYIVRSRFSRGGLGKSFAWSDRLRGGQPGDANAWDTFRTVDLPAICDRVRDVRFLHEPAANVIHAHQHMPDALIYCDPPYLPETRTARKAYEHEMTDADHLLLLNLLSWARCKAMLSGYRSDLYDASLDGWHRVEFDMPNHSGQGRAKQRRTECLWMNFEPPTEDLA